MNINELIEKLALEVEVKFALAGGPGGQNVNKVNSKALILWNFQTSQLLNQESKERLQNLYPTSINKEGFVSIQNSTERSQLLNKEMALKKLAEMIIKAKIRPKIRKKTKPSFGSIQDRLKKKKKDSDKKRLRREKF